MRFIQGMPPEADLRLATPRRLNDDYDRLHVRALVFGLVVVTPLAMGAWATAYGWHSFAAVGDLPPIAFLFALASVFVLHEWAHLLGHPKAGLTSLSVVGAMPRQGMFYASYLGVMTRTRFVVTALLPMLLLSVLPFVLAWHATPAWRAVLTEVSVFNAMASAGDLWIVGQVFARVPRGALIQGEWFGRADDVVAPR